MEELEGSVPSWSSERRRRERRRKRAKVRANMAVLQIVRAVDMMPLGAGVDRNGRKRDMCTGATRAGVEDVGLWTWKGERWGLSDRGGE